MVFWLPVFLVIFLTIEQCSTCMPVMAPDGVIPITDFPEEMTMEPTTTAAITTSTTTDPCPTRPNTAKLVTDDEFRQLFNKPEPYYNIRTHEEATCSNCADGTVGLYTSGGSAYPANANDEVLLMPSSACLDACICNKLGQCFKKGPGRFGFILYSYCSESSCAMYFVISGDVGSFVPVSGSGKTYLPDPENEHPVTDGNFYLEATSISCVTCIKTTCI